MKKGNFIVACIPQYNRNDDTHRLPLLGFLSAVFFLDHVLFGLLYPLPRFLGFLLDVGDCSLPVLRRLGWELQVQFLRIIRCSTGNDNSK